MGLNWAAALDNFSKGMGQIAQVKYSEFMRKDEAKRREVEREIDFQRQQNLARFQVQAQKDMQAAGFTHAETLQGNMMDYNRERATADDKFRAEQLDLSRQQVANSGAAAATSAAESRARLDLLKEQADNARKDRALAEKLRMYQPSLDAANAEIKDLTKYKMDLQKIPAGFDPKQIADADARILELRQTAQAAQNGIMTEYLPNFRENLPPERLAVLEQLLGDGVPVLEAVDRTLKATSQKDVDPAADQNEFIPTGGGAPGQPLGNQDPSERGIGGTVVPAAREQTPAPKFNVPPGLRVPGAGPPQDYTVSGITPTGDYAVGGVGESGRQVVSKMDEFNLTNGASMAAGDAALAGGGSARDIGASVSVAIRSLSPAAQQEVTRARSTADLSPTTIDELKAKNYNPDTLIGYLRRNG